jgi:carbon monoxide dehydrogenase subunit G
MKIVGSYTVPAGRERTYEMLQDPVILAKCMPGTERLNKIGDDHYEMKMKMMIAAVSGSFDGKVKITDQNRPESFRLLVDGTGKIGFLKGDGLLKLKSNGDSATQVDYEGEVHVGGNIAAVGQRLLDTTSKMIIKKFFEKLVAQAAEPK